jgi:hypothetical protein
MSGHLRNEQLAGYVHHTLTDAQREELDRHLVTCPSCRARLADYEVLQRRIRHDLQASLRVAHPSPAMTFATLAPRLKRTRRVAVVWDQSRQLFAGAAALAVMIVQALVLLALFESLGQLAGGQALMLQVPVAVFAAAPTGATAAQDSGLGKLPAGWFTASRQPQAYDTGIDYTQAHSGDASGYIRSKAPDPADLALMQTFRADEVHGQRLRLSGYLKTEEVAGRAYLWLRVDGPERQTLRFDSMAGGPITGTTDWQAYQVILHVPENAVAISFGVMLQGAGQVWVDDFDFEVIGDGTSE